MTPRNLVRWDRWLRTFLKPLPKKRTICVSHFSTLLFQGKSMNKSSIDIQQRKLSNIVESPFPKIEIPPLLIPELIWNTVDQFPEAIAVKCGITGRLYTYGELQKLSRRFMNSLIKAGFSPGDVVAVVLPNCPEFPVVTFGALEADMTVSFINHAYTADEVSHQLQDSGSVCVVSGVDQLPVVQAAVAKLEDSTRSRPIRRVIAMDIPSPASLPKGVIRFSEMIGENVDNSRHSSYQKRPNDIAFLPYSSGTTGLPKGVCLSHHNIVSNIQQFSASGIEINNPDKGQDILLGLLPLYHIYGLLCLLNGFKNGSQTITLPKFEPKTFIHLLENAKLSMLNLVPPLVLFIGQNPDIKGEKHLAHVKFIMSGAAPLGVTDLERFKEKIPKENNCLIIQAYGMTEMSPVATIPTIPVKNMATCGACVSHSQGKIICLDTGKVLGPHQTGELCFRGPQVMMGYHNKPQVTAEMIDAEGWLRTGDIGYYDEDSHFYIQDRLKELIKVKGLPVPPAELEAVLRTHPVVSDAGVIGVPEVKAGEVPVAFIVRAKGKSLSENQVKDFLSKKVAKHKQVSKVIFVDSIPKSAAGKILRKDLQKLYYEIKK